MSTLAARFGIQSIQPIRLVLLDDHPVIIQGLDDYFTYCKLEGEPIELSASSTTLKQGLKIFEETQPDILLLDLWFSCEQGAQNSLNLLRLLKSSQTLAVPCILFTGECQQLELLNEFKRAGIAGIVFKHEPMENLLESIYSVYTGSSYFSADVRRITGWKTDFISDFHFKLRLPQLSKQEVHFLWWALQGYGRTRISEKMMVAVSSVSEYRERAFRKLKIKHIKEIEPKSGQKILQLIYPELSKN